MIGIDTNVLVRFILDDDPVWSPAAAKFMAEALTPQNAGYINLLTLAEVVWALKKEARFDRAKLVGVIEALLESENLVLGEAGVVERALGRFRKGNADFADYLIAELNSANGAEPTVTIDKRAARNEAFLQLPSGA
ncbi:PIN domain-containing protein [Neorhizobium sp. DT-125]|uniref:PIN domain-containing protein n=1 Tax=Neorhizobium sp. DT-125 TaxID=3396163 RepID=UPI003F1B644F